MTDCETCGKPLGPGDSLGCVRCMGASRYVATIEQRRELVRKANRERQSIKPRDAGGENGRRVSGRNAKERRNVSTDAGASKRNHGDDNT